MNIQFTGILLRAANNNHRVAIDATTLAGALAELTAKFPSMDRVLLDNTGNLRTAHRVFLNGELIPHPDRAMPLGDDDRIEFFTAVAGG
ncbi:MoaD/ThiS family protein [Amycolatopsis rubida]|uniref:MoaD/ThiS family protein n=1 Tax=Amycolatopsis rubida TaxID=112413 RepID=A0ABX0CCY9_9PSEU|nr:MULTISPECIES: MoaD/ThiS family protein [Amycolatopsis]MYW97936.1 MoaD/ThiS family protein [Amycolatopsis rubida]NEC62921.1 MoaD/ThiS family protein [Amycolatopsis rubida]OAP24936.1 ThiS family protein [Amycolatopsis sp. M39]